MSRTVAPLVPPGTLSAVTQPEIAAAGGLLLRPWRPGNDADVAAVLTAFADPEIQRWGVRDIATVEQARSWLSGWAVAWAAETDACWAVVRAGDAAATAVRAESRAEADILGRVALRRLDLEGAIAEVTYWVLPDARRQGVATRAAAAVSGWAFEHLGLHRLELCHSVHNPASCAVAGRIGFDFEGTQRDGMLHVDGWHDMHLHALVAASTSTVAGVGEGRGVGGTN